MKVFINPQFNRPDKGDGGIRRVVEAQVKYLPEFGVDIAQSPQEADVIATHGGDFLNIPGIPSVNHNHGLYWSRYKWGHDFQDTNAIVIQAMRCAVAHTCPSHWVAVSLRRGMLIYPEVVYHGVNADEWQHNEQPQEYVLWNKARSDFVSNPQDMEEVARKLRDVKFMTTIATSEKPSNVEVFGGEKGRIPYEEMKPYVMRAGVYLCTARETFGINTLEALAAGVPVAGWRWGGQEEIIRHGHTGYLAKPGDYNELADCIRACFAERERLSANAVEDARSRWRWRPRIQQYADLYKRVHKYYSNPRPKVSVIVTAYNLDIYLPECLESVSNQSLSDFECVVVDDALSDTTRSIVEGFSQKDRRFKYRRPKENLGLPGARNFGLTQAKSLYIRHLDADDRLKPNALELEANALDADWGTHIAYGHLENINEDGSPMTESNGDVIRLGWPPPQFSWRQQIAHLNQLPSTCMVRRRVFEDSGGYRVRMKKAEDAEFWLRVTSLGFVAKKVTQAVTMEHRLRKDSKGAMEWEKDHTDGNWTAWFPWRSGASDNNAGRKMLKEIGRSVPNKDLVPFGAQGAPPQGMKCWPVHDFSYPVVSIIVTVGPGHEIYLRDALDSIWSQTYPDWECFVVNDTGKEWNLKSHWDNPLAGFPWVNAVSTMGNFGVCRARNVGAKYTHGSALIWMDADDYWLPNLLERMVAMLEVNNGIIYSQLLLNKPGEDVVPLTMKPFDCQEQLKRGMYPGSSILIPRWIWEAVWQKQQGWDENIPGQEDWDFQIACAAYAHACAYQVDEPLFVYRYLPDGNREKHKRDRDDIIKYIDEKWAEYRTGKEELMCGCNEPKKRTIPRSKLTSTGSNIAVATSEISSISEQTILLEYLGTSVAAITIRGPVTRQPYRFGLQKGHNIKYVYAEDARQMLGQRDAHNQPIFKVVQDQKNLTTDLEAFLMGA